MTSDNSMNYNSNESTGEKMEDKDIKEVLEKLQGKTDKKEIEKILQTPQGKKLVQDMAKTIFPKKA